MVKGSGCNLCVHPTCHFSRNNLGVSLCMECNIGILVLDPSSNPKWKLACNKYEIFFLCVNKVGCILEIYVIYAL